MNGSLRSPVKPSMICASRPVPKRGDHQRLRLAAGEQRRTMGAGQHAGANLDRPHRLGVAAVDARMSVEDALAHQPIFQIEELAADLIRGELRAPRPWRALRAAAVLISPIFA